LLWIHSATKIPLSSITLKWVFLTALNHLLDKSTYYGTGRFITRFTTARH
jgi:hypothetical protein